MQPYSQKYMEERKRKTTMARKFLGVKSNDDDTKSEPKAKQRFRVASHNVLLALHNARRHSHGTGLQSLQITDEQHD